eukprot:1870236-Amphidinium_carterae.1
MLQCNIGSSVNGQNLKGVFTHTWNNGSGLSNTMTMCNPEFRMVAELRFTMREGPGATEDRETVE